MDPENLRKLVDFLPFLATVQGRQPAGVTRIAEMILSIALGSGIALYANDKVQDANLLAMRYRIDRMDKRQQRIDDRLEQIQRDIYLTRQESRK